MEKRINEVFNNRYDYLLECSNNILKLITRQDLKYELVGDAYLHLNKIKDTLSIDINVESVIVRWMTMQVKWKNTQFKKNWVYPNKHITQSLLEDVESYVIIDETIPEDELLSNEKEIQDKLNHIYNQLKNMSIDKKFLFENIFQQGINTSGKLSRYTGISRTSCYYLIQDLKKQLSNGYKTNTD